MAFGAGAMVLLVGGVQLIGNQFGYDRAGFRAYVLSPVPRREILLGKNLAVAPLGVGDGAGRCCWWSGSSTRCGSTTTRPPWRSCVSAYLVFCLLANALSILAPIPMAAGSMQPAKVKLIPVSAPDGVPDGAPARRSSRSCSRSASRCLLAELADVRGWPVSLVLSLLVLAITVFVYRIVLTWQGEWLAAREQAILEVVTSTE